MTDKGEATQDRAGPVESVTVVLDCGHEERVRTPTRRGKFGTLIPCRQCGDLQHIARYAGEPTDEVVNHSTLGPVVRAAHYAALRAERDRFETLWNESQAENERLNEALTNFEGRTLTAGSTQPADHHGAYQRLWTKIREAESALAESQALLATAREALRDAARAYHSNNKHHHYGMHVRFDDCQTPACPRFRAALASLGEATPEGGTVDAETLARWFHEEYETRAPDYGYATRRASAVPWEKVPEKNRHLMVRVAQEILNRLREGPTATQAQEGEG